MIKEPKISDNVDYLIERKQKSQWNIFSFLRKNIYAILITTILISIISAYFIINKKLDYYEKRINQLEINLIKIDKDLTDVRKEITEIRKELKNTKQ